MYRFRTYIYLVFYPRLFQRMQHCQQPDGGQVAWQSNGVTPEHSEDQGLHSAAVLVLKPDATLRMQKTETSTSTNLYKRSNLAFMLQSYWDGQYRTL